MLGYNEKSQNLGSFRIQLLHGFIVKVANEKSSDDVRKVVITRTVDELVLGGYTPELFQELKAYSKGLEIPMNFSILLEVSNTLCKC